MENNDEKIVEKVEETIINESATAEDNTVEKVEGIIINENTTVEDNTVAKEAEIIEETPNVQQKKMNHYAIASFVCSIIGLFVCGMPLGLAAIITGINGLREFDEGTQNNRWMAIAGLIIGIIDVIFVSQYMISIYNQTLDNYRYFNKYY